MRTIMNEVLWADHHHAKYRIGDLTCLLALARESGANSETLRDLRKQLRAAIAVARSIADQRNAEIRDEKAGE